MIQRRRPCSQGVITVLPDFTTTKSLVEGLQLVSLHRSLVFVQVRQWVLRTVVVGIIVGVDGLSLQACDGVKLLDGRGTQAGQRPEDRALDLSHLRILDGVDEGVLRLGRVVLELLGRVLLAEWRNLVEVHLQVVGHLLGQVVLRGATKRTTSAAHRQLSEGRCAGRWWCSTAAMGSGICRPGALQELAKETSSCLGLAL